MEQGISFDFIKKVRNGAHFGAVNGTRTRDPRLGKPMLYQLSYYRRKEKGNNY